MNVIRSFIILASGFSVIDYDKLPVFKMSNILNRKKISATE